MAAYAGYEDLQIGASVVGLAALSSLASGTMPMPKTSFQEAVVSRETANGQIKNLGKPVIVWEWPDGIDFTSWNALRDELSDPNPSGVRYISSPDKDGSMQNWKTVMQWDPGAYSLERFDFRARLTIRFTRCVEQ